VRDFVLCALSENTKYEWIDALNKALAPFRVPQAVAPSVGADGGVLVGAPVPGSVANPAAQNMVHKSLLFKRGPRKTDAWKVRWVVLDARRISYYKDEHDVEELGSFDLTRVTNYWSTGHGNQPPKEAPPDLGFKLIFSLDVMDNGIREFVFCALSEADKYHWGRAIERNLAVAQGKTAVSAPAPGPVDPRAEEVRLAMAAALPPDRRSLVLDSNAPRPLPGAPGAPVTPGALAARPVSGAVSPRPPSGAWLPPKSPTLSQRDSGAGGLNNSGNVGASPAARPAPSPRSSGQFGSPGRVVAPAVQAPRPPVRNSGVVTPGSSGTIPAIAPGPPPTLLPPPPLVPPPPLDLLPPEIPELPEESRLRGFTELGLPPPPPDLLDMDEDARERTASEIPQFEAPPPPVRK
jgi:hypothetical protein